MIGTERCLCIMELNVIGIIGIEVELPSSELNYLFISLKNRWSDNSVKIAGHAI